MVDCLEKTLDSTKTDQTDADVIAEGAYGTSLTIWLFLILCGHLFLLGYAIYKMFLFPFDPLLTWLTLFLIISNLAFIFLMLCRKKLGVYGFFASQALAVFLHGIINPTPIYGIIATLPGVIVLIILLAFEWKKMT